MKDKLKDMEPKELMILNSKIMIELKEKQVIRTKNNPIADYCEWLVSKKFNWNLQNNSNAGFDVIDNENLRVQIKCRTLEKGKGTRQLGVIRNLDGDTFDYLIGILFNEHIEVVEAYLISKPLIKKYSRYSKHQNGHILSLKGELLNDKELNNITNKLQ